jgi:hypothetical protein
VKHLFFSGTKRSKTGEKMFEFVFPSGMKVWTKDPLKTLNRTGNLFYFTPEYLLEHNIIDNMELVNLLSWRKKYGKLKRASILEIK